VFGVGCGWALQSGEWLANAVAPVLEGSEADVDSALEQYARRHHTGLAAHEKFCSAYSTGHRFNPLEKLLYRAAARDRYLAGRMAEMGGRWITPPEMLTPGHDRTDSARQPEPSRATHRTANGAAGGPRRLRAGVHGGASAGPDVTRAGGSRLGTELAGARSGRAGRARGGGVRARQPGSSSDWTALVDGTGESAGRWPWTCPVSAKRTSHAISTTRCPPTRVPAGRDPGVGIERVHLVVHDFGGRSG